MKRLTSIIVLFQIIAATTFSQTAVPGKSIRQRTEAAKQLLSPELQVDSLLEAGSKYLYKAGKKESDLLTARTLLNQALDLSKKYNYTSQVKRASFLLAVAWLESQQPENVKQFLAQFSDSLLAKLHYDIAWSYFRRRKNNADFDSAALYGEKAATYYRKLKPTNAFVEMLRLVGFSYYYTRSFRNSEAIFLEAADLNKNMDGQKLPMIYNVLSSINVENGNYNKSLFYSLEAIRQVHITGNIQYAGSFHYILGNVYRNTGDFSKAIISYDSALKYYRQLRGEYFIRDCIRVRHLQVSAYIKMHREQDALTLIKATQIEFPPASRQDSNTVWQSYGDVYTSLKDFGKAEEMYLMIRSEPSQNSTVPGNVNEKLAALYIDWEKYDKAAPMMDTLYKYNYSGMNVRAKAHFRFMMYKLDSARGRHLTAMQHLMENKKLDDFVTTEAKNKEINALNINFDTENKDRELKSNAQSLLLLNRQSLIQKKDLENTRLQLSLQEAARLRIAALADAEAKSKNRDLVLTQQQIKILQQRAELQKSNLSREKFTRNIIIGSAISLLVLLLLIFGRYRYQKRTNKQLQLQQQTIKDKNNQLSKLVMEKEWLLTEVHHRVKNNLHTIFSLLESQSAFLENDALAAILNSQHRVYAMSLIHQKLYHAGNLTTIDINEYLRELISYLSESFNIGQRVVFDLDIENIQLDVSAAVPVGLIVNEAITNSYKYAFENVEHPSISVSLKHSKDYPELISLVMSDNGKGFPADFDAENANSLGVKLMRGLTDDLNGNLKIYSSSGTRIEISFDMSIVSELKS